MKIGIITRHDDSPASLSMLDKVTRMGHEGLFINPDDSHILMNQLPDIDGLIVRLSAQSQPGVEAICEYYEQQNIPATATVTSIRQASDKLLTSELLSSQGVPTPTTQALIESSAEAVLGRATYPAVIKIANSSQGKGVIVVESLRSARSVTDALLALDQKILIQEFIDADAIDLRIIVVNNQVVAAMKRSGQKQDEFRSNVSAGGTGSAYTPSSAEAALAISACRALDCPVAGIDIIYDAQKGPLVLEVNVSPGLAIQEVTGINIVEKYVEYLVQAANNK